MANTDKRNTKEALWVFDMDGTLHASNEEMWDEIVRNMLHYTRDKLGLPVTFEQAEQDHLRDKWQTRQTTMAYMREYNLDYDTFIEVTHMPVVEAIPFHLRRGIETIHHLPGEKIVLTNSPERFAHALLAKMGIRHLFNHVIGLSKDKRMAKPHPTSYQRVRANGRRTIMIEDWHENLVFPHQQGWTTVWFPERDQSHRPIMPEHVHTHITSLEQLHALM